MQKFSIRGGTPGEVRFAGAAPPILAGEIRVEGRGVFIAMEKRTGAVRACTARIAAAP